MNFRWLWLDHFPQGLDLTQAQRAEVKRLARAHRKKEFNFRNTGSTVRRLLAMMTIPLSLIFTMWVLILVGWRLPPAMHIISNVGGILLFQAALWTCITYAMYRTSAPYVRKALCDIGEPVCMECGYSLRGLSEREKCPECGAGRTSFKEGT